MWRVPISYIGNSIIYLVFRSVRQSIFQWNVIFSAAIQDRIIYAIWSFMRRFSDFCSLNYFNRLSIILLCASLSLDVISLVFRNILMILRIWRTHLSTWQTTVSIKIMRNSYTIKIQVNPVSLGKYWSLLVVIMSWGGFRLLVPAFTHRLGANQLVLIKVFT